MKKTRSYECLRMVIVLSFSLWILISFHSGSSFAAEEVFPNKEINLIISMAAGGGRDFFGRGVAKTMGKYLGVPVVVMNVTGAGGALGLTKIYQSPPDGYTIGTVTMPDVFAQVIEKTDYDVKKCTYIGRGTSEPLVIVVRSDSPFHSMKDLKTYGKPIRLSAFAYGTPDNVATMIIANREGWPLKIIGGFKGAAPAVIAVSRGDVEISGCTVNNAREYFRAGQLRPIMTTDSKRHPDFPDMKTVGEQGHPDLEVFTLDYLFMAPPGVPKARVKILEDAFMKTVKDPEFIKWAKEGKVELGWLNGEDSNKRVSEIFEILEKYKGDIQKYMKS
jgi:tripartite-type tricarboxylate transporter receptor subunit TctC